ncbi:hypothetical protein VTO42DRAFT_1693 [Malbranchea cinnamomea]
MFMPTPGGERSVCGEMEPHHGRGRCLLQYLWVPQHTQSSLSSRRYPQGSHGTKIPPTALRSWPSGELRCTTLKAEALRRPVRASLLTAVLEEG